MIINHFLLVSKIYFFFLDFNNNIHINEIVTLNNKARNIIVSLFFVIV